MNPSHATSWRLLKSISAAPSPHKTPPSPQIGDATDGKATSIPLTGGGYYYHILQEADYEQEEEDAGGQRGVF